MLNPSTNIFGKSVPAAAPRLRIKIALVSGNATVTETIGTLAAAAKDKLTAFETAGDLNKDNATLADCHSLWLGPDMHPAECEALIRAIRGRHRDMVVTRLCDAEQQQPAVPVEFATMTPAVAAEYEKAVRKSLALYQGRVQQRQRHEFRAQIGLMAQAFAKDRSADATDYTRKVNVAATMCLFETLQVNHVLLFGWTRPSAPRCEFSWGMKDHWGGRDVPDLSETLARTLIDGSLHLDPRNSRHGTSNVGLLQHFAANAVLFSPGRGTLGATNHVWVGARCGRVPFDAAATEFFRLVTQTATAAADRFAVQRRQGWLRQGTRSILDTSWFGPRPEFRHAAAI